MTRKNEPKVLVVAANPFSDINNNGKTLKSIFSSFDKSALFELYFRPQDNVIGDGEFAQSYYAVSELDIIRSFLHFNKHCGGIQLFDKAKDKAISEDQTYNKFLHGRIKDNKTIRSLLWKSRRWNTKEFKEWYRDCDPDVVFALLGGPGIMYTIAEEISKNLSIPLVIYFTDDYLIHPIEKTFIPNWRKKQKEKAYRKIVKHSSARYCIGELMCKEYSEYFGVQFSPIMNCVDVSNGSVKDTVSQRPIISYFGGLGLNRWKMIVRFAKIVNGQGQVCVYTKDEVTAQIKKEFEDVGVQYCGFVVGDELNQKMKSSDALLHIESDDDYNRALTALSISTKIPEYMVSGRLIIAFGPSELASMRIISDNGCGIMIPSDINEQQQRYLFDQLVTNKQWFNDIPQKAMNYAKMNFDKNTISQKLKEELIKVCKND